MPLLPDTLEDATTQAIAAMFTAIEAGCCRLLIDMRFPELDALPIARSFALALSERYGQDWQALFADAGVAALAKRDWADLEVSMRGVNEGRAAIRPEDRAFLLIAPSSIEVDRVEKLLALAGDRPFIMLNPRLENSEVGLGLTARRLRDRFLSTFELCYYIQPLENGALYRHYPQDWQVYQQSDTGTMQVISDSEQRPSGDEINRLIAKVTGKQASLLSRMQQFLNALGR